MLAGIKFCNRLIECQIYNEMTTPTKFPRKYRVSMDALTSLITLVLIAITIYIVYGQTILFLEKKELNAIIVGAVLIVVMLLAIAFKPLCYILTEDKLVIKRLAGDISITKKDVKSAEILAAYKAGTLIRGFGIGGYFGYTGRYYSTKLGWLSMYATRRDKKMLITTNQGKQFILTPDETDLARALMDNN